MTEQSPHAPEPGGRIDSEIHVRQIVEVGAWLFGTTIAAFIVGYFVYRGLGQMANRADRAASAEQQATAPAAAIPNPPAPALQAFGRDALGRPMTPESILLAFRESEEERLSSWGWIDRSAGIAHVPIERAIEMLAVPEEPAAPTSEPTPAAEPAASADAVHGAH